MRRHGVARQAEDERGAAGAEPGRACRAAARRARRRSSTPSCSSAGLTWSCGPTETPPESEEHVGCPRAPSASAGVGRGRGRRATAGRAPTSAPACRGQRREGRARWSRGSGPGRAARRARRARRRWPRSPPAGAGRRAAWRGPAPAATPSSAGPSARPARRARRSRRVRPRPRRARGRPARSRRRSTRSTRARRRVRRRALDRNDGVGAAGHRGAGRDAHRLAVAELAGERGARPRLARRRRTRGRPGPRHREAVHRAVGERRDVVRGDARPRPARGRARRPARRPRWPAAARPARIRGAGLVDREHRMHSACPSADPGFLPAVSGRLSRPSRRRPGRSPACPALDARAVAKAWLIELIAGALARGAPRTSRRPSSPREGPGAGRRRRSPRCPTTPR